MNKKGTQGLFYGLVLLFGMLMIISNKTHCEAKSNSIKNEIIKTLWVSESDGYNPTTYLIFSEKSIGFYEKIKGKYALIMEESIARYEVEEGGKCNIVVLRRGEEDAPMYYYYDTTANYPITRYNYDGWKTVSEDQISHWMSGGYTKNRNKNITISKIKKNLWKKCIYASYMTGARTYPGMQGLPSLKSASIKGDKLTVKGTFDLYLDGTGEDSANQNGIHLIYDTRVFTISDNCKFLGYGGVDGPYKYTRNEVASNIKNPSGLMLSIRTNQKGEVIEISFHS